MQVLGSPGAVQRWTNRSTAHRSSEDGCSRGSGESLRILEARHLLFSWRQYIVLVGWMQISLKPLKQIKAQLIDMLCLGGTGDFFYGL